MKVVDVSLVAGRRTVAGRDAAGGGGGGGGAGARAGATKKALAREELRVGSCSSPRRGTITISVAATPWRATVIGQAQTRRCAPSPTRVVKSGEASTAGSMFDLLRPERGGLAWTEFLVTISDFDG